MNLLQILRVAGHTVTDKVQMRPLTSLLSAGREGKGQDGFGLDRNPVERRRFIDPPARRLYPNTNYKRRFVIQPAIFYHFKDFA